MRSTGLLIIAGVAIVTLLFLVYLAVTWETPDGTVTVEVPVTSEIVPEPVPEPVPEIVPVEPPVQVVIEEPATEPEEVVIELPALNDSDSFIVGKLQELQNGAVFLRLVTDQQIIRRFVVFVDNISKGDLPQTNLPYRPLQQEMPVRSIDENLFAMEAAAYGRFDNAVNTLLGMNVEQTMLLYRMLSPLFQEAYAELGFGEVSFDTTLQRALRYVIAAETPSGNLQLIKPSVMYLYADATIESMRDVEKQLLRLGPENTQKLKTHLRAVLQQF
jgi:hypothetical protein